MIPITDEQAKALQELAKTTNTAIEITGKAGSYLGKIAFDPLQALSAIATDELHLRRRVRFAMRYMEARETLRLRGIEPNQFLPLPEKLAVPLIETASLENDETLQGLWKNLIANALDKNYKSVVRPAFIDIIKQLEPDEAIILTNIWKMDTYPVVYAVQRTTSQDTEHYKMLRTMFVMQCVKMLLNDASKAQQYLDNLLRLQLLTFAIADATPTGEFDVASLEIDGGTFLDGGPITQKEPAKVTLNIWATESIRVTDLGKAFIKACIADNPGQHSAHPPATD